jgi:hypothetical protein
MQERTNTTRAQISGPRAVRTNAIEWRPGPDASQIRTCVRCGRSTRFVPDDPTGGWYVCTGCSRYA